jgi:hypothetical protein
LHGGAWKRIPSLVAHVKCSTVHWPATSWRKRSSPPPSGESFFVGQLKRLFGRSKLGSSAHAIRQAQPNARQPKPPFLLRFPRSGGYLLVAECSTIVKFGSFCHG